MNIVELDFASCVNVLCLLVVEDVCILDGYIVNHTFCAVGYDAILAATNIDVADVDVLEVWQVFLLYWLCLLLGSHVVVPIGGFEGDGITCDIGHVDMVDIDIL